MERFTPLEILGLFRNSFLSGLALGIKAPRAFLWDKPRQFSGINPENRLGFFIFRRKVMMMEKIEGVRDAGRKRRQAGK